MKNLQYGEGDEGGGVTEDLFASQPDIDCRISQKCIMDLTEKYVKLWISQKIWITQKVCLDLTENTQPSQKDTWAP